MSDTLVRVENVSKKFCRDLKRSLWYGLKDLVNELLGRGYGGNGELRPEEFWAMKDVSFELKRGECLGLIGRNGAGKTTLLRMLNGLIKPDAGKIDMRGRVGALIALGAGFNPILTGRENLYVNATIFGFTKREINHKLDEIVAFAELGDFIDSPVQSYSNGMQVRLAFAIAATFDPDILLIDEALSVGDAYFQQKSFSRIRELRNQGVTILFVSHDKEAVHAICTRAILINEGRSWLDGEPASVLDYYNALLADHHGRTIHQICEGLGGPRTESGTLEAQIIAINILDQQGKLTSVVGVGERITVQVDVRVNRKIETLVLGCGIKNRLGQMLFGTNTYHTRQVIRDLNEGEAIRYNVEFEANLGIGFFSVHCSLVKGDSHIENNYHTIDRAKMFEVVNKNRTHFIGCAWSDMRYEILRSTYLS